MQKTLLGTALLLLLTLAAPPASHSQSAKKPKSPLSSGIDSNAASGMGGAKASALTEDGEFLRRVMLDLVGYPPNLDEVKAFIANTNPDKRSEKIDQLLDSEDWADRTARLFCEGWFGNYHKVPIMLTPKLEDSTQSRIVGDFVSWLKLKLQKDAPYNREIVDQIIKARGTSTGDPAMLWKLACYAGDEGPPVNFANRLSKHFLGIRLICAQCHDHPFAEWKTSHFYKLAAFFGRTKAAGGAEVSLSEVADTDTLKASGASYQPQFIHGQKPGKGDGWMDALSVYMTGPDNPQLTTAVANRVWSWLFGRGLVHPVDDFNDANKPMGGGLLGLLGKEFKASKYSVKSLYRGICNSDTYQRASENETRMAKPTFAAGWIKHLDPEQLLNSIQVATSGRPAKSVSQAISMVEPLFPADVQWCEVSPLPGNMRQALLVRNNSQIQGLITGGGVLSQIKGAKTAEKVEEMFLAALSRKPTPVESERFCKYIDSHAGQGAEDAYWTLLNTTEFLSRH
ncbi:MAG TPA: DUF1549 domain-containing protein [Planctomycetota bacterium]|nr:DUF1549 domain-containing protein [Planctomycetota bacterium]